MWHTESKEEVLRRLETTPERGLTAEQASKRLAKDGPNRLKETKRRSLAARFFDQFKDVMIIILLIAALISFVVTLIEQTGEFVEPLMIVVIVVLNACLGVAQESKAEKALEALKKMSAPHARVRRDGKELVIDAAEVATGDILLLEAGDYVPADARLLQAAALKVEESALTGESVPAEKDDKAEVAADAPLGDRLNMIYSGCSVTYGRCTAVVTGTGMNTEMGKIADLLAGAKQQETPLQQKLAQLGKYLGFLAVAICIVIFAIGIIDGMGVMEIFMVAVSLAVSAIPEGLPAIVTIVLSLGVQRMVKRNAIIKSLPAVETLGSASVICSDKTGTLTQNRMTLMQAYDCASGRLVELAKPETVMQKSDSDSSSSTAAADGAGRFGSRSYAADIKTLLTYATLCCDGSVVVKEDGVTHIGDPTETSIVYAAYLGGIEKEALAQSCPRLAELPFDSDRKLMSVVCKVNGKTLVITKGAFDVLADRCVSSDIDKAREVTEALGRDALRVIAVAVKEVDSVPQEMTSESVENGLTLIGLVAMIDPPREEAREAVKLCKAAGIRPVMITGDHVVTASAIGKQLGILNDGELAITGVQLAAMDDAVLEQEVKNISVYARVSPEDKIRIVQAWQKQGEVVAMTGDGVNDAPALKAADIGCAMGITGTDVAKGAADMTLTDDNFATIVEAVQEGRSIYGNIKKAVAFLLGTNIGEVFTVFFSMLLWKRSPLLSMQLLLINMVTDSLPAIAIGMEQPEPDIMKEKPKKANESIFAHGLGIQVVLMGAMFGLLSLAAFYIGGGASDETVAAGRTMAFIVLSTSQVIHAFNMRSARSLFKTGFFSNRYMNLAAAVSLLVTLLVVFVPPLATLFGLTVLRTSQYLLAFGLAFVPLLVMELAKALRLTNH